MFFGFQLTCGMMLLYYGYTVMKNPRVWGDQGRRSVKAENFVEYAKQNGLFFMNVLHESRLHHLHHRRAGRAGRTGRPFVRAAVRVRAGLCLLPPQPLVQGARGPGMDE